MELTDLKSAVDAYADAAETGLAALEMRLGQIETKLARPGATPDVKAADDASVAHKTAFFEGFIRKGDDGDLRALEKKALSTVSGGNSGYGVPGAIDTEIERQLKAYSPLRQICKVRVIDTPDYKRLLGQTTAASGWVGEEAARGETTAPTFREIAIQPGELYANAAATQRALDDLQFDAESWLLEEVAEEFAAQESAAVVSGNGVNKPKGFLTYAISTASDAARADDTIQYLPTGVAGDFAAEDPADILIDLVHALKARYRQGAVFLMNSKTLSAVRKFKDSDGNFLWRPGLLEGQPGLLLGYPVIEAEEMPDVTANSLSIAFGNFERAYTLVERQGTRVLRDPYSNKPFVQFYATRRVGGALVNDEALKLVRFAAS
ncbi:phage major capsid protein [Pseudokordiimonas caeni]|uniref:phage major capsid protein n=1 Tax=Pseudokordiimonas caeni TaxID=2997908 RepID=UPI00281230CF|nr:phage major capsid protein [Pseudokordiimonas caeni]